MRIIISILLGLLLNVNLIAQDSKAKGILDELSANTKGYTSMKADFTYQMLNKADDIDESQEGSLLTKGDKYRLNIAGQLLVSDGKTVWTILEDAEEVQINNVPEDDEEGDIVSPNKILNLWEKGFKFQYDKEAAIEGENYDVINLFPIEAKEKSFHTIKLFVKKDRTRIGKITIKGKDGTDYIYSIKKFEANPAVSDQKFSFSANDYPDFDMIDLR